MILSFVSSQLLCWLIVRVEGCYYTPHQMQRYYTSSLTLWHYCDEFYSGYVTNVMTHLLTSLIGTGLRLATVLETIVVETH